MITEPPHLLQEFLDRELALIRECIPKVESILEVGCGYGRLLDVLRLKADIAVGIDFSRPMLERAKLHLREKNVELYEMNAENMNFPPANFDYAVCLNATFGNMPGIEENVLQEMKRVSRRGLMITAFAPEAKDTQFENYKRIGLTGITDDGTAVRTQEGFYSRRFTRDQLDQLFRKVGLEPRIDKFCTIGYVAHARL
jgi:ubiquinone/menaquinone biosynthesis C-methylase UbiE